MAATVALRVAGTGCVLIGRPVAAHVPELDGVGWRAERRLRDLLPAGLASRSVGVGIRPRGPDDETGAVAVAVAFGVGCTGRAVRSYSNAGWCLLGRANGG